MIEKVKFVIYISRNIVSMKGGAATRNSLLFSKIRADISCTAGILFSGIT